MKKITYQLIINDKELNEIYKKYKKRVSYLERNLNNRTPGNIGLHCRYLTIPHIRKEQTTRMYCDYGQAPDLEECVECYGLVYDNITLAKLEETLIKVRKSDEKVKPELKSLSKSTIKFNEDRIKKYMKKSMLNFIKKTDKFTK